jgi:hypothetical protein
MSLLIGFESQLGSVAYPPTIEIPSAHCTEGAESLPLADASASSQTVPNSVFRSFAKRAALEISTGEPSIDTTKKQKTPSNAPDQPPARRRSQRLSVIKSSSLIAKPPKPTILSETIDASKIIHQLAPTHRLPFSVIPETLSFIKPLRNLCLEDEKMIPKINKKDLPRNYVSSIEEKGIYDSLVCVAEISEKVGRGVFAKIDIKPRTFLGFYAGKYTLSMQSERDFLKGYAFDPIHGVDEKQSPIKKKKVRQQLQSAASEIFGPHEKPEEGYEIIIDAEERGNFTSLINDGQANANVVAELRRFKGQVEIAFLTSKTVRKGHQLLIRYGSSYWPALEAAGMGKSVKLYPTRYRLDIPAPGSALSTSVPKMLADDASSSSSSASSASASFFASKYEAPLYAEEPILG